MLRVRSRLAALAVAVGALSAPTAALAQSTPQQTLDSALTQDVHAAGGSSGAYVVDLTNGAALFSSGAQTGHLPASVEKLYTTSTALLRFGPTARLTTQILGSGTMTSGGTWVGTLFIKGGGDPTFGSNGFDRANYGTGATMQHLVANLVHATGIKALRGKIVGDGSYFDGLRGTPATGYAPSLEVEGELDGLSYDRGWLNSSGTALQSRPTLFAAQAFAAALKGAGVKVPHSTHIAAGVAPSGAQQLALVRSPTVASLIKMTNTPSDNYFAETLLKDIGSSFGGRGSTATGASVVRSEVASTFGIAPRLNDGSGLSRYDSTTPTDVVTLLEHMAGDSNFVNSLAVAGESGTLQGVDSGTIAKGHCRGKTGTLSDTANVAGYCQAKDGHTLAYAFLTDGISNTNYVHNVAQANMMTAVANYDG